MEYNYLVEFPEKEPEAIRRFLQTPLKDEVFHSLGFDPRFFWYLLQLPHRKLVPAFEGDVDIIAGHLEWNNPEKFNNYVSKTLEKFPGSRCIGAALLDSAASGGVRWPPSTNYLVGIEVK